MLHGYRQGHQLLASSIALPAPAQRALLALSDTAGATDIRGFHSYLTGYPVPDAPYYALARTWDAPELPRPGSVWTHTLLVHVADLAHLEHVGRLLACFRRPPRERHGSVAIDELEAYEDPVRLPLTVSPDVATAVATDVPRLVPDGLGNEDAVLLRVVSGLYGHPARPVLIVAPSAETVEPLVMALWDQQWPRLRRSFAFCTGAAAGRRVGGEWLDLYVVPPARYREFRRELPDAFVAVGPDDSEEASTPDRIPAPWVDVLARDLRTPVGSPGAGAVRRFLTAYAAEAKPVRAAVAPMAALLRVAADTATGAEPVDTLVDAIGSTFPDRMQGARLKRALFGVSDASLTPLVTTSRPSGTSGERLELRATVRGSNLLMDDAARGPTGRTLDLSSTVPDLSPNFGTKLRSPNAPLDPVPEASAATYTERLPVAEFRVADEPAVLGALATTAFPAAFDPEGLALRRRAARLWSRRRSDAEHVLARVRQGPATALAEPLLRGVVDALDIDDVATLAAAHHGMMYLCVQARPELATAPGVWRADDLRIATLFALGTLEDVRRPRVKDLVAAAAREQAREVSAAFVDLYGASTFPALLDWLNGADPAEAARWDRATYVADEWGRVLREQESVAERWLLSTSVAEVRDVTLAVLTTVLRPTRAIVAPSMRWQPLADALAHHTVPTALEADAAAFVLAVALSEPAAPAAPTLAATAFPLLHDTASGNRMPERAWRLLVPTLPQVPIWREWDRAERIRHAFVAAAVQHSWPGAAFLEALSNPDVLERSAAFAGSWGEGKRYLKGLLRAMDRGELTGRAGQWQVIRDQLGKWGLRFPLFPNVNWLE